MSLLDLAPEHEYLGSVQPDGHRQLPPAAHPGYRAVKPVPACASVHRLDLPAKPMTYRLD